MLFGRSAEAPRRGRRDDEERERDRTNTCTGDGILQKNNLVLTSFLVYHCL